MKPKIAILMVAVFFGLWGLSGCGDQKQSEKAEKKVTAQDVEKKVKEAAETTAAYTQQQKDEYLQQIEAKMKNIDQQMQELTTRAKSKATELKEDSKNEFNQSLEDLNKRKQAAAEELKQLKSTTDKAWGEVKSKMDAALDELNKALARMRSHFA